MPTNGIFGLAEFALHLKEIEHDMKEASRLIVRQACIMVATKAKRVIGTYDYGWPQLAPSTLEKKSANTPLLETGEMRASIQWSTSHDGMEGHVGSNNDKAVWQELGTSKSPPRSFLAGALHHEAPEIVKMAGKVARATIGPGGLHSPELEFLHLLKHIGHEVNEVVQKALDGPEDENKGRRR
jgi:HK97 gp10 family phage protein